MELWCGPDDTDDEALRRLIDRLCEHGLAPVVRAAFLPPPDRTEPDSRVGIVWQMRDDPDARARLLLAGADEVIGPWMHDKEALARVMRLDARARSLVLGELQIDLIARAARRAERPLGLLAREFELLVQLARPPERVHSRGALLKSVWRLGFDPGTNVVEVHVSRLRAKLDRGFARPMLHTIRGEGYCLRAG